MQTCIACLTEIPIEEIPRHYVFKDYDHFFHTRQLIARLKTGKPPIDNALYIAAYDVAGVKEIGHVVIYRNGRIIHDPKRPRVRLYRILGYYEIKQTNQTTQNLAVNSEYDKPQRIAA